MPKQSNYKLKKPIDEGEVRVKLERQVEEIRTTTKETNNKVSGLSISFAELKTLVIEGNKSLQLAIQHIDERSRENEKRVDEMEETTIENKADIKEHEKRIKSIEDFHSKVVWAIVLAFISSLIAIVMNTNALP